VYITGTSLGNLSVFNSIYNSPNSRQFITKLWPGLDGLHYSTNFGASNVTAPNIVPSAFFVDRCENVYICGWGGGANTFGSPSFPHAGTANMFVSPDAFQSQTDGSDFYLFVLQKDAVAPLYGSYFGQLNGNGGWDHAHSTSRFSSDGFLYLATCANCKSVPTGQPLTSPYPITAGSFSTTNNANNGGVCDLGLVKMNLDFSSACNPTNLLNVFQGGTKDLLIASPNPNKGFFKLSYHHSQNGSMNTLRIIDMSGKKIFERPFKTTGTVNEFQLQLPFLNHGVYLAEVINAKGNVTASCKFLVN
jgi:Secretion system C-terminal sorting domain